MRRFDLIEVDYEELPVVSDPEEAMEEGAPLVEPEWGDNIMASRDIVLGDPDAAFAEADGTISGHVRSARITGTAIEPRGCVASYDAYAQTFTFWDSTQNPHPLRNYIAGTLGVPETSIRVIQPHVGGGFGLKIPTFQEEPLVAYLSRKLGRPVKWIEERSENFQTGGHARDTRFRYEAAFKNDGTVTGIRLEVIADVGAPRRSAAGACRSSRGTACRASTRFRTGDAPPVGRDEQVPVERVPRLRKGRRLVPDGPDHGSHREGDRPDRAEIRFKNFIPPQEFPFPQVSGAMIDSGEYAEALRTVLDMVDYEGFAGLQEEAQSEGATSASVSGRS